MINQKYTFLFLWGLLTLSCGKEKDTALSLLDYIEEHSELPTTNELIACAAGGKTGSLHDNLLPISLILKPHDNGISDLRYYKSTSPDIDPNNLDLFIEQEGTPSALLSGFLQRYRLAIPKNDHWLRVSFIANDSLWYCKPIRIKYHEQPTTLNNADCTITLTNPVEPLFEWGNLVHPDNVIFFQVVSDISNKTISGTYTTEPTFQFYKLSNVVLNVTPPLGPPPQLEAMEDYIFTLMGVSEDNWVNFLVEIPFNTSM